MGKAKKSPLGMPLFFGTPMPNLDFDFDKELISPINFVIRNQKDALLT